MRRRNFVLKSGLASVALSVPKTFLASNPVFAAKNDTVNLGVIGTGDRGAGMIPLLKDIKGLNVVACSDILSFRLEEGLSKVDDKAKGYSDYRKLLDSNDIDAVLIATPFSTHSKIAIDALDAGKHVFCEKTMAKGYAGIQQLVAKEKNTKKVFQTGHQYRSSRLYNHIVDLINEGKLGKIQALECQWNRNGNWRRPVPEPQFEQQINWRMYREFSGGLLAELCSHQLDFVSWALDENPEMVTGVGGVDYWKDGRETYDNIHLIYSYPSGVKATFTCLTGNSKDDYKIKVFGDQGTLILDYGRAWFHPEGKPNKEMGNVDGVAGATVAWDEGKGIPINMEHTEATQQALIDFRDNIVQSKKPTSNITTGAAVAISVQMGLDAMYNQKIVKRTEVPRVYH